MITIRSAHEGDAEAIAGFQESMALETEGKRLDAARIRKGVRRALGDEDRGFYLVAESEGQTVGSLFVTREWSDWRNGWFWWIQSVFVDAAHRRRGVYRSLHAEVVRRARSAGEVVGIRLYVERENVGAQATYESLGMERTYYLLYELAAGSAEPGS